MKEFTKNTCENEIIVRSDHLHKMLKIKTRHNDWAKRKFEKLGLEKINESYKLNNNGFSTRFYYNIPLSLASKVIENTKGVLGNKEVLEYLKKIKGETEKEVVVFNSNRKEYEFGEMLKCFLKEFGLSFDSQVSVCNGKYRIDFLIGLIAIEYDEKYHESAKQKEKDFGRMKEIDDWFLRENLTGETHAFDWIRIKEGEEIKGLAKIVKLLNELNYIEVGEGFQPQGLEFYMNPEFVE